LVSEPNRFLVFKLTHQISRYVALEEERVSYIHILQYFVPCKWSECDSVVAGLSDTWGK
jgi:hypothetical protein